MKQYRRDFNFILGVSLVALVFLPVLLGFFWTPYEPSEMNLAAKSMSPSLTHLFGTDYFGRDIFSRVMEGARMTFLVGAASILIGAGIGIFIGALTGYFGGPVDEILMRVNDGLASFPSVLLALVLVSIFGSGKYMIILTLGIVFIPSFARVARSEFIAQKEMDYVKNARLMGAGDLRIMFVHILPNTKAILLSAITIGFNNAVLAEAGLSYLSIGAQPTDVSLGRMLSEAQGYLMTAPWFALAPGLTIVITVLGFSLISEALTQHSGSAVKKTKKGKTATQKSKSEQKPGAEVQENMKQQPGTEAQESMQMEPGAEVQEGIQWQHETEEQKAEPYETVSEVKSDGNVLLDVNDLSVGFYEENEWDYVVKNADFTVNRGEVLGIVGESGSGKSMTALAVMGLLKKHGRITSGQLLFEGKDLTKLTAEAYQRIRGFDISMVFQEPMTSLNPVMTVGHQVEEMLRIHGLTDANRYDELNEGTEQTGAGTAVQLTEGIEQVRTGTAEQLTEGTGQMGTETAEQKETGTAGQLTEEIEQTGTGTAGQLTEGTGQTVKENDSAYRKRCKERTLEALREAGLKEPAVIYGKYPHELSGGMRQRVMIAMAMICNPKLLIADEPTTALDVTIQAKILKLLKQMNKKHGTSIIFISHDLNIIRKMCDRVLVMYQGKIIEQGRVKEVFEAPKHTYTERLVQASLGMRYRSAVMKKMPAAETLSIVEGETKTERKPKDKPVKKQHMIDLRNVNVFYSEKGKNIFRPAGKKQVVDHVTFHINEGEIFGLVGESGCGKSSLAKAIVGLQKYVEGDIILDTESPCMVFQDPYGSLNPAKKIGWLLTEPLRMSGISMTKEEQERWVDEILTKVDLPLRYKKRYPADLSGGQRQRVAIALALILNQKLIILDEPVSALDVTVQEQILELLLRLRRDEGLSYLFISHDMQVIRKICDYVCVMYQGKIVENARTEEIFTNPQHEYTRKLIRAAE